MKKTYLFLCVCASFLILAGSSIWEGATMTGGDLPETGLYMATNSFPINTVVEVTNLENGIITRAIVYSGLDTAGFLALLSKDAAGALNIQDRSLGRIRMNQVSDLLALSRFTEERAFANNSDALELSLVPAENRPPVDVDMVGPDPDYFISPIVPSSTTPEFVFIDPVLPAEPSVAVEPNPDFIDPALIIAPVSSGSQPAASAPRSIFSAPTIKNLERGKYYLQIAAYSNAESVNPEISKIDKRIPIAVMDAGTTEKPLYRVLLGPLSIGEAGALLQRYRSTYSDAFVRYVE